MLLTENHLHAKKRAKRAIIISSILCLATLLMMVGGLLFVMLGLSDDPNPKLWPNLFEALWNMRPLILMAGIPLLISTTLYFFQNNRTNHKRIYDVSRFFAWAGFLILICYLGIDYAQFEYDQYKFQHGDLSFLSKVPSK